MLPGKTFVARTAGYGVTSDIVRLDRRARRGPSEAIQAWAAGRIFGLSMLLLVALVGIRLLFPPISFVLPLALPTALAGWYGGRAMGSLVAVLGPSLIWITDTFRDVGAGFGGIAAWEVGSSVGLLMGTVIVLGHYRSRLLEEEKTASTDPLTELPNRGAFLERLEEEIARSGRYGYAFTLVFLDLDGFKGVNDRQGHDQGDLVLARVADGLRASTRQTDNLGRLGGDEFAAVLPHTTVGPGRAVIEKLQTELAQQMERGGWPVTFSIGAVTFEASVEGPRQALQLADEAMYQVKHGDKAGVHHVVWDGDAALP
jgi:diguanylate cyclase (GGDEF)-like protein